MKQIVVLLCLALCGAQGADEHWVTTWATAQQLVAPAGPPRPARTSGPEASGLPASFADQTVRMAARVSVGGKRVRIELSNMLNAQPLEVGAAHVAILKVGGEILEGSDRPLTFGSRPIFTIPPGALAVSDPVDLALAPLSTKARNGRPSIVTCTTSAAPIGVVAGILQ